MKTKLLIGILTTFFTLQTFAQVSDYADAGNGDHKDDILWLTWNGTDLSDGIHDNDQVTFSTPMGGTLQVTFTNVSIAYPIADPTPGDGETPDGYLPADMNKPWCGATLYTAYDLSGSSSEMLHSDMSAAGVLGDGENGQDIAFDVEFEMIINGVAIPVDALVADPETTNPNYSETTTVQTNASNWELIENIRGTNYGLNGLGTSTIQITNTELGFGCSGGVNNGTNSSPILMSKGQVGTTTKLSYDLAYPNGDGHSAIILGILLPFDQGDAPASYGVASHYQSKVATSPGLASGSDLYLGNIEGDSDYHINNPLFSATVDGDDNDGLDDEDGLINSTFHFTNLTGGNFSILASDIELNNSTGASAKLHTWIDFDNNGTFDSDEYAVSNVSNGATQPDSDLAFTVPSGSNYGNRLMRLRLTSDNTLDANKSSGVAHNGEVEDFEILLKEPFLDFDGVDDYLSTDSFIEGLNEVTVMGWVKSDSGGIAYTTLFGEDRGFSIYLANGNQPLLSVQTAGNYRRTITSSARITLNEWHHVAGSYSNVTGEMKLYVDGKLANTVVSYTGSPIESPSTNLGSFEIGRLSSTAADKQYFKGDIDEVRVFDTVLTDDQLQRMVYQEIRDNSGAVHGEVIPKDIVDISTGATVSWSNLIAYYRMGTVFTDDGRVIDYSGNKNHISLNNISTWQEETAPMPYESSSNGDWINQSTWLHGDVWDIKDIANNKDWSIVHIKSNVTTTASHTNIGLLIDSNRTLTIEGDNQVSNSWYLELDGTLNLKSDSQLVQTKYSDLVTSSTGKIQRRQEGASSYYWYNYWSSPVGKPEVSTLTDNNSSLNNGNNSVFSLDMLKDSSDDDISFTSSYHQEGKLSTRWMYTYENGVTYYDWSSLASSTDISPGVGYIHKGMGIDQQYIFEGKPNNGTIKINVTDAGGSGSVPAVSKTEYLMGNPYPSALDVSTFINDNVGVIGGSIQVWQQWAGESHTTTEYEGGYGVINKLGSIRAYQFRGGEGAHNGSQDGTKTPSKYLPVGQSFLTEIVSDGKVEFNNAQRVFIKESDANGNFNNGSVFFRETSSRPGDEEETVMQKLRLEFNAIDGQATRRELLLGFSSETTDGYDYGYDAKNTDANHDDLNLLLGEDKMVIQAYGELTSDKVVPLSLKTSGSHSYTIKLTELESIDPDQEIYLRDNLTDTYTNLRGGTVYSFSSEAGEFNERFELVFENEQSLSTEDFTTEDTVIYYSNSTSMLYVKSLNTPVSQVSLINMLGQTVYNTTEVSNTTLENGLSINKLATGIYIVSIQTEENQSIDKKIIID